MPLLFQQSMAEDGDWFLNWSPVTVTHKTCNGFCSHASPGQGHVAGDDDAQQANML
jgi:hypothetical protein